MQRVSAFLPSWEKRNSGSNKTGTFFGRRASQPPPPNGLAKINTETANLGAKRVQREAFWPATLDLECDKAARILKSFCGMWIFFSLLLLLMIYSFILRLEIESRKKKC